MSGFSTPPADARASFRPDPPLSKLSGRILRTWMEDRAEELRRRERGKFWRIIFPRQPLRIVRARLDSSKMPL